MPKQTHTHTVVYDQTLRGLLLFFPLSLYLRHSHRLCTRTTSEDRWEQRTDSRGPIVPIEKCPRRVWSYKLTHTVHMALVGYLIVFSFVTKCGQTIEFLLWGTIVPLNFLVGYHCSIVASTPQPMAYAFTHKFVFACNQGLPLSHFFVLANGDLIVPYCDSNQRPIVPVVLGPQFECLIHKLTHPRV